MSVGADRHLSADRIIEEIDLVLRTLLAPARGQRAAPANDLPDVVLTDAERRHAAGLMRVNHCGEICAQALYQGQALTSRDPSVREALRGAALEETDHLAWTEERIGELGGRTSLLNPLWYMGSLALGVTAGILGDKWNLGFLAETERQVEAHLDGHLTQLPDADAKSRAIVDQMRRDEIEHAETAIRLGAAELPQPVKQLMKFMAKGMTTLAYRV